MDPLNPGQAIVLDLLARAQAYCVATATKQTALSRALTDYTPFDAAAIGLVRWAFRRWAIRRGR